MDKLSARLNKILETHGAQVVAEMITRLSGYNKIATGNLKSSLGFSVKTTEDGKSLLEFHMADYGKYVDKGRRPGKQPPLSKIRAWCKLKGIPTEAAYPIARKIGRFGIPPTNFFTIPISRRRQQLADKLAKASAEEIVIQLKEK